VTKIAEQISEFQILRKIKPYLSSVLGSRDHAKTVIKKISKLSQIEEVVVKELFSKYRIYKLLTVNTDVSELMEQSNEVQKTLNDVRKFVLQQYERLHK